MRKRIMHFIDWLNDQEAIEIQPSTNYTAVATLKGLDSHYGTKGLRKVISSTMVACPNFGHPVQISPFTKHWLLYSPRFYLVINNWNYRWPVLNGLVVPVPCDLWLVPCFFSRVLPEQHSHVYVVTLYISRWA